MAFSSRTSTILKLTYLCHSSNDFDEIWHGDAVRHSWRARPLKIQNFENPRWWRPPPWKCKKNTISRPRFERFQRHLAQWRSSTLSTLTNGKNFKFRKYKMAAATTLKHLRTPYLSHGSSDFAEIWHTDAVPPSWPFRLLRIWNFLNPGWRRPPSWKIEKSPYLGRSSSDFDEIWPDDTVRPSRWNFPIGWDK